MAKRKKTKTQQKGPWLRAQNKTWYVNIDGKQVNLGKDKDAANRRWLELQLGRDPDKQAQASAEMTMFKLVNKFLSWTRDNRDAKTLEWYERHLLPFVEYPSIGHKKLASAVNAADIDEFIGGYHKDNSDNTRAGAIRAISRLFNWADQKGVLKGIGNPTNGVDRPAYVPREAMLKDDDWDKILDFVKKDDPFRDFLIFMLNTGCRPQEARLMTAKNFKIVEGMPVIQWSKKANHKWKGRTILLNDTAHEIVLRLKDANPTGPLIRNEDGNPFTKNAICARFNRLQERFGFEVSAYTIRHKFCTDALRAGENPLTVSMLMGHKSTRMVTEVYNQMQITDPSLRGALDRVRGKDEIGKHGKSSNE